MRAIVENHHGSAGLICSSGLLIWLRVASAMYEVSNGSKKGSAAAMSLRYLVAVLILLQYYAILLLNKAFASRSHAFQQVHLLIQIRNLYYLFSIEMK